MSAVAYWVLVTVMVRAEGRDSTFARALGSNFKGKASLGFYLVAIPLAFVWPPLALALCTAVARMWLVPDRRFESRERRAA